MRRVGMIMGLLFVSLASVKAQSPSLPVQRLVLTETDAYGILPNEIIAAPTVQQMKFSSDSRYLLLSRVQFRLSETLLKEAMITPRFVPPGEMALVLWDSRTRHSREVWKTDDTTARIQEMVWLPKANIALVNLVEMLPKDPNDAAKGMWTKQTLLRIGGSLDKVQPIALPAPDIEDNKQIHLSPSRPLAVLERTRFQTVRAALPDGTVADSLLPQHAFYIVGEAGRAGIEYVLPPEVWPMEIVWTPEGIPIVRGRLLKRDEKNLNIQFYALDARAGKAVRLDKEPALEMPAPEVAARPAAGLSVKLTQKSLKEEGENNPIGLLWLESAFKSEKPRALVSSDASEGRLLPKENVIVFTSQGSVLAAPLLKISKAQYLAMKLAAERAVAISNAKQVGLSLIMYAQDNNETFPGQDGVNDKISPYLKNDSLLSGFNYTFGGGSLANIERPAETELGYIAGSGGRAMIFADGHVKWRPD